MNISDEKVNKILFWIIKIGIFAILFVPLVVGSQFYFPFIVLKNVVFRIIVEVILVAYVVLAIREPKFRPKLNAFSYLIIIFFIIATITNLTGINFYRNFWGNYERMGGLFRVWHLFAYFIILISVFKRKVDWMQFFTFSIFVSTAMGLFAFAQKIDVSFILGSAGGSRLTGTIGNPTYLAAYMLFNIFFLLYFFFRHSSFDIKLFFYSVLGVDAVIILFDLLNKFNSAVPLGVLKELWGNKTYLLFILAFQALTVVAFFYRKNIYASRIFIAVLFIFQFLIFFWTQTRGAVLGFFGSLVVLFILGVIFVKQKQLRNIFIAVLVFTLLTPFFIYFGRDLSIIKSQPTLNRLASISPNNITTQSRLLTWKASLKGWTENPMRFVIGNGDESYYYIFNKHFPSEIYKDAGSQIWFDRAHNIIFDVGISYGVVGLIIYLGIFLFAFLVLYKVFKKNNDFVLFAIFTALLVAYFGQNLFVFDTLNTYILFYLVLGFIAFLLSDVEIKEIFFVQKITERLKGFFPEPKKSAQWVVGGIVFIIVSVSIYSFNIRLLQGNNELYKALRSPGGDIETVSNHYIKALDYGVTGRYEARQRFIQYALKKLQETDRDQEKSMDVARLAETEQIRSIEKEPLNVRHHLILGTYYNAAVFANSKYNPRSVRVLRDGISLSPTRPQLYFELGQAYLIQRDKERGLKYFEKGLELSPRVVEANFATARAYILTGEFIKAQNTISFVKDDIGYKIKPKEYNSFVQIYERTKEFDPEGNQGFEKFLQDLKEGV